MLKNEIDHIDYSELIPKYLSGSADLGEIKTLEDWVLASEENREMFLSFKKAWILTGISKNQKVLDIEEEWNALKTQIKLKDHGKIKVLKSQRKSNFKYLTGYAAAILIIIASTIGLYRYFNNNKVTTVITLNEVKTNSLPDGSEISLNSNSKMSYSVAKEASVREIKLDGDAFFQVSRDTNRVFKVVADDVTVEVLGTEFYVDSRKEQSQIVVIVKSGTVSVRSFTEKIILEAGQSGFYDKKTRSLYKSENNDLNYLSWKTGILVFEKTELSQVVYDLNRNFGSNIKIENPVLNNCKITATFENKSIESIIKIIEKTLKIKSKVSENGILFTGRACNSD